MALNRSFFREMSISRRLLLWFLLISCVPGALITSAIEFLTSRAIGDSVRRELMQISESRATEIENFIHERRKNVSAAGRSRLVVSAVERLEEILAKDGVGSPALLKEAESYRKDLEFYCAEYGFTNVYLFGKDGSLLLQMREDLEIGPQLAKGPLRDTELAEVFARSNVLLQSVFSDFQIYPGVKEPLGFTANPVFDSEGG